MLPHALSDEACSLVPGVDRLAVTAEIRLDADGRDPLSAAFYRSRIRSDARLDYEQLDEIFAGRRSRRRRSPSRSRSPAGRPQRWPSAGPSARSRSSRSSPSSSSTTRVT